MRPAHDPLRRRSPHGLTLIELTIVLALTATLVSLAVPSFAQMMTRQRLKAVAENMALDMAELRLQAAQRGVALHLHIAAGSDWCYATSLASGCDCRVPQQCQMKTVHANDHPGVAMVEGQSMRFEAQPGFVTSQAAAVLQSVDGQQLKVALTPLGRPTVCAPTGAMPGYAAC